MLEQLGNLTIFVGKNAVGKTTVLEAIQLISALKSFRATQSSHLVKKGNNVAAVEAKISNSSRLLEEKMVVEEGKRKYYLNGKPKQIKDLKGMLPAVVFVPDDLGLVKGSNAQRRSSLDSLGTQLSKNFYAVKLDYQRLIKQKNQLLKDAVNKEYLASMNEVIAKVGAQYYVHRSVLCSKIKPYLEQYYSQISNGSERVELCYLPSWGTVEDSANREHIQRLLQDSLDQREEEERARKKSVVGPHTDDIQFILDGENALHFASQGQQRSIVLAYKMAEASLIQEILGQKPLLLLDDVMSELDEHRRSCFVDFIGGKTQTFITTTNLSYFDDSLLKDAEVIKLPIEDCCP